MTIISIIAIIICFMWIYRLQKIIDTQNQQIDLLNRQLNEKFEDLNRKTFFNYNQIKRLLKGTDPPNEESDERTDNKETSTPVQNVPLHDNVTEAVRNTNPPKENVAAIGTNAPQSTHRQSVPQTAQPPVGNVNPYAPKGVPQAGIAQNIPPQNRSVGQPLPKPPIQHGVPAYTQNAVNTPNIPNTNGMHSVPNYRSNYAPPSKPLVEKEKFKSLENWIGTRLLNIVASLLVFIGLILFGTLDINQTVKMVGMHIISVGVITLGTMLTRKNKTIFSLGLTGCGFGALFITILVTHIYFNAIPDFIAFSLLLVWIIAALFISKLLDSVILSVTAHMGMAISVCCAFSLGFSAANMILPVIYQIASITVIILGNIFCCKKTYRFGLLTSMSLLVYSSIVMLNTLNNSLLRLGGLSAGTVAVLFAIQTLGISFISYLLSVSTTKLYNDKEAITNKNIPIAIHIANKVLWAVGILISVGNVFFVVLREGYGITNHIYPAIAACVVTVIHLAVTLFMSEKLNFHDKLANISIWVNSIFITLMLLLQAEYRDVLNNVPFIFVYATAIIAIIKFTNNKSLNRLVTFLLSCDMLYMTFFGYNSLAKNHLTALAFIYLAIICSIIFLQWFNQNEESREKHHLLFKTIEYLWVNISIIVIIPLSVEKFSTSLSLTLIILLVINIIAHICKYAGENDNYLKGIIKTASILLVYISFNQISSDITNNSQIMSYAIRIILILACLGLYYFLAIEGLKSKSTGWHIFTGVTFAFFINSLCMGFSDVFSVAGIYADTLSCRPFFFVLTVAMLAIFKLTKNNQLYIFTLLSLGIDAMLMLMLGYQDLKSIGLLPLGAVYTVITCTILFFLWYFQNDEGRQKNLIILKTIGYLWVSISIIAITPQFVEKFSTALSLTLIILLGINIIAHICKYAGENNNYLKWIIKAVSILLVYTSFIPISIEITSNSQIMSYVIRIILILACLGLYYFFAIAELKSKSTAWYIFTGVTFAFFINSLCMGFSNVFTVASIYADTLSCRPFFFVLTVAMLVIFKLTRNNKLYIFTLLLLGIDAMLMLLLGYQDLKDIGLLSLGAVYTVITCVILFFLWYLQNDEGRQKNLLMLKTIGYLWLSISAVAVILLSEFSLPASISLITLAIFNLTALLIKYSGQEKNYLHTIIRIISVIVLYLSFIEMSLAISSTTISYYIIQVLLMLVCAALYTILAREWIKSSSVFKQILAGLTFTVFVISFCNGFTSFFVIAYIFSIICMLTALLCVILGFTTQAKGLRLYGLSVIIICVLKLVTVDISSANSTARVVALILGGMICFAISGLYNRAEQKFAVKETVSAENDNSNH